MAQNLLEVEIAAPFVAVVALARPPVNALGRDLREELLRTFDALQDRDDVRAIVLTARGKVFCAGADIKEKQALGARRAITCGPTGSPATPSIASSTAASR